MIFHSKKAMRIILKYPQIFITIISALILFPLLGNVHLFDWDEINFAEAAREMIVSKNYLTVQIDYLPFWEKPPLFIWMQVLSMKIFGVNEFAARFPNAICGIVTLLILFRIGKKLLSVEFGLWWALAYAGSILPLLYFTSGIIDPWFNLFIFLGLYFFILYSHISESEQNNKFFSNTRRNIILSAVFVGLGILTKGPVALLIFGLTVFVYLIINKFKIHINILDISIFIFMLSLVGGAWFIVQILDGNIQLVKDFLVYQMRLFTTKDAGHGGFLGYHFVVLLFGVFPASVFAWRAFDQKNSITDIVFFKKWMLVLFWTVLILFTIVKTKIIHYSSLCYFPLTFLGVYALQIILNTKNSLRTGQKIILILFAIIFSALIISLPIIEMGKANILHSGIINDSFAAASFGANVQWGMGPYVIGILFLTGMVLSLFIKHVKTQIVWIFFTVILFSVLVRVIVVPRIEIYTQQAAIEFYESKKNENCYIRLWKFKSYAHLFYSNKQMQKNTLSNNDDWLLMGSVDKPVYFVTKNTEEKYFEIQYPKMQKLYSKNGFVFFGRKP